MRPMVTLTLLAILGCAHDMKCDERTFLKAFGSSVGDPDYREKFDYDHSGQITTADFAAYLKDCSEN
jgi:hypothetical protein